MKKLLSLSIALAGAASLHCAPALAEPGAAWPVPGFEQMLADSRSAVPAVVTRAQPDVLYPFFQAPLWSEPPDARFAASPKPERKEI